MSLEVKLNNITKLRGKADRFCTLTFRGIPFNSLVLTATGKDAYFKEDFYWPLETTLDQHEYVDVQLFSRNKVFSDRIVGKYRFSVASIMQGGIAEVCDQMFDSNQTAIEAEINMTVIYTPPEITTYDDANSLSNSVTISITPSQAAFRPGSKAELTAGSEAGSLDGSKDELQVRSMAGSKIESQIESHSGSKNGWLNGSFVDFKSVLQSGSKAGSTLEENKEPDLMEIAEIFHPKLKHPKVINVEAEEWMMKIRVIEARDLAGVNPNPYVVVTVNGDEAKQKQTKVIRQTCNPEWDEEFVFDFMSTKDEAMDQVITFELFSKGGRMKNDTLMGMFKCDVWYIQDAPESALFAKFAPLLDAFTFEMKGYLRLDLQVYSRGAVVKDPPPRKEEVDIGQNLILPPRINPYRAVTKYQIRVYAAEGIPKMTSSYAYMANLRGALMKKKFELADPFVQVTFAGVSARTKVIKNSYSPKFNQQINFTEFYPPLCKRIKIELFDKDLSGEEIIGTAYLDLTQISNPGNVNSGGFMPTFGPSWIHLYGGIRDYGSAKEYVELSRGIGEGVAYRGRVLLWLDTKESEPCDVGEVEVEDIEAQNRKEVEDILGREQNYQLFATFYEASMIPRNIGGKTVVLPGMNEGHDIQFEIAIGEYGFKTQDEMAKETRDHIATNVKQVFGKEEEKVNEDEVYNNEKIFVKSITKALPAKSDDKKYFYVPFGSMKPNVHIKFPMEDQRRRHYNSILLRKIETQLERSVEKLDELVLRLHSTNIKTVLKVLKRTLGQLVSNCKLYLDLTDGKKTGTHLGKNDLDRERDRLCSIEIKQISVKAATIAKTCDNDKDMNDENIMNEEHHHDIMEEKIKKIRNLLNKVKKTVGEPQCGLPDIFVWMIVENKRVAYARLPAEDFLYSSVQPQTSEFCGRVHTMYLRLPGKLGHGAKGWSIQAKIEIRIWLGLLQERSAFLQNAPKGYEDNLDQNKLNSLAHCPPPYLNYNEQQNFVMRAHIYQARGLIGGADSGLSDAFLRCVCAQSSQDTYVVWKTRSPTWNVMLKYENVKLWGDATELTVNPPTTVLEIFHKTSGGGEAFIGRTLARPIVKLAAEKYDKPFFPPALEWFKIYRGETEAGELLAAFEMLQKVDGVDSHLPIDPVTETHEQGLIMRLPKEVKPKMERHRIEILFWGVRDLQKVEFQKVTRPMVELDCCYKVVRVEEALSYEGEETKSNMAVNEENLNPNEGYEVMRSTVIANTRKNPNFHDSVDIFEVEMPKETKYWPPMQIKVLDCRDFGRKVLCGTNLIHSLDKYFMKEFIARDPEEEEDTRVGPDGDDVPDLEDDEPQEQKRKKKKKPGQEEEEEEVLDWWARFHATLRDIEDEEEQKRLEELQIDGNVVKENRLVDKIGRIAPKFPFKIPGRKSDGDDNDVEEATTKPGADIPRLTVYKCELEKVKVFNGFTDFMRSFDLERGKRIDDDDEADKHRRYSGKFKGHARVWQYPLPAGLNKLVDTGSFYKLPSHDPISLLVRVYIVRCFNLYPMDSNGKADPYVECCVGKKSINRRAEYVPKTLEPEFGQCYEFKALIPFDCMVNVKIWDHDLLGLDDFIGGTKIDIENLFFSKHRPRCGIQKNFITHGYAAWRDPEKPSAILSKLCKELYIDGPDFREDEDVEGNVTAVCTVGGTEFKAEPFFLDENGNKCNSNEPCALEALNNFESLGEEGGFKLCPEYVETRLLHNPDRPGMEMGKVQMWVDMFPMDLTLPKEPVNIDVRKPDEYELRVIIWNTEDVLCDDTNLMGEAVSDIYIKVWLEGMEEKREKTDVHYSARDGLGLFNWRMLFPFQYHKAEEKFVTFKKDSFFSVNETAKKHKTLIYIQAWDANLFSSDDFIGDAIMRLARLPFGAKSSKTCTLKMFEPNAPTVNFFKIKTCKGWWPVQTFDDSADAKLGKDGEPEPILAGKIEIEFDLKTKEEAEANPVGKRREEPEPLEKPNRPSRFQFLGPLTLLRYMIWEPCKWNLLKCVCCLLIIVLFGLFLYSMPGYTIKKILGA